MAAHSRRRDFGRAPGIIVGAAIAVAVIIGFVGGLIFTEIRDDDTEMSPEAATVVEQLNELGEGAPPCSEMFAAGRPVAEVLAAQEAGPCLDPDGEVIIVGVGSWECPDGTKVHQIGDFGWGRDGQRWQGPDVPEPYADCVLPGTDAQHP